MPKMDVKFYGDIRKTKDGSTVPEDEYVVFLAKDNAFFPTLLFYRDVCSSLCCDDRQLNAVDQLIARVALWRRANPDRLKHPDIADGERLLDPDA